MANEFGSSEVEGLRSPGQDQNKAQPLKVIKVTG